MTRGRPATGYAAPTAQVQAQLPVFKSVVFNKSMLRDSGNPNPRCLVPRTINLQSRVLISGLGVNSPRRGPVFGGLGRFTGRELWVWVSRIVDEGAQPEECCLTSLLSDSCSKQFLLVGQ